MKQKSILPMRLKAVFILLICSGSWPVLAVSLDELRASGAIIERFDGYVQAGKKTAATEAAVNEINAERRRIYQQRAASQGVSADQVGRVYARQIFESAPAGTRFLLEDGKIMRK